MFSIPRKRTSSFFDHPLPRKSSRMNLRRTESFLSFSDCSDEEPGSFLHLSPAPPPGLSYTRIVPYSKEHREKHRPGSKSRPEFTIGSSPPHSNPSKPPKKRPAQPSSLAPSASANKDSVRKTSPLAPARKVLPPRASFPRSKPEPDLYRVAIKKRMENSPEGEKILRMGPRPAVAILTAMRELERIVSAAGYEDDDVVMVDDIPRPPSSAGRYWRVTHAPRGQGMVHCGA
ncbi:hypothetical protein V8B97DRAFT_381637 [Scleroderma yunnanense]